MDGDQAEGPGDQGLALGNELREEGDVENADLGIEHVAQHALEQPVGRGALRSRVASEGGTRAQQQVQAQPAEVGGAAVLEQGVGQLRHGQ